MSFLLDFWVPKEMRNLPVYQRLRRKMTITMVVLGTTLVIYFPLALAFSPIEHSPILLFIIIAIFAIQTYWMSPETKEIREWLKARRN